MNRSHRNQIAAIAVFLVVTVFQPKLFPQAGDGVEGEQPVLLLSGARVLNSNGDGWLENVQILIVDGRIQSIAPSAQIENSGIPQTLDLDGQYLLPGLIDLHSHLLLHPYDETSWNDQVLRESLELRTIRAVVAARTTLEAGFTTLRDLGTEGAAFADVALRDAIDQGIIPGPRILASTRAIVATGSYGPLGFDPRWDIPKGAQVADGEAGVRRAVREQIAAGSDWIKVYADYRRREGAEVTPTFSQSELNAIVDEARSAGLPVAAHATTDEAIRRAVMAGVKTIEHGYGASVEVLKLMRDNGVILCPTLAASEASARYKGWEPGMPEPLSIRRSRQMFARALKAGVTIACGSDVGVFSHGDNVRELELMVTYGLSPVEAVRAATSTAAKVLGMETELGSIEKNYIADLIAVRGDPLQNISFLWSPVVVIKEGKLSMDRR